MRPKRLRPAALVAAALFATIVLLANIPGQPVIGPNILNNGKYGPHFECGFDSMTHGWPWVFLTHDGYFPPRGEGPSAWAIGDNAQFTPPAALANAALLVVGTAAVGWLVNRRSNAGRWRFGLTQLLVAVLGIAVIMALAAARLRVHQAQVTHLQLRGHEHISSAEWQPFGPYWLRVITGPDFWAWGDQLAAVDIFDSETIAGFPGKSQIKVLRIEAIRSTLPSLSEYKNLIAIDMMMISDAREGDFEDDLDLGPCLAVIARCESLEGLNLFEAGVKDNDLRELSSMPRLQHLDLSRNAITDDGLAQLAPLKSLRRLGLWDTEVTKDGVSRLQQQLPECEIDWSSVEAQEVSLDDAQP